MSSVATKRTSKVAHERHQSNRKILGQKQDKHYRLEIGKNAGKMLSVLIIMTAGFYIVAASQGDKSFEINVPKLFSLLRLSPKRSEEFKIQYI